MTCSISKFNVSRSFVTMGTKSTILLFNSIFRKTPAEVSLNFILLQ